MAAFDLAQLPQPRPFTKAEYEASVVDASLLRRRLLSALQKGREAMWELAGVLYDFEESSGWLALGYDDRGDWLEDEGISCSTYLRLVSLWRELVVIRTLAVSSMRRLDPSKVQIVLPALKAGDVTIEQALEDAETLTQRELREAYRPQLPAVTPLRKSTPTAPAPPTDVTADPPSSHTRDVESNPFQTTPAAVVELIPTMPEGDPDVMTLDEALELAAEPLQDLDRRDLVGRLRALRDAIQKEEGRAI